MVVISRKPPYQNTKVDPERTQGQINKLLKDYGAQQVQWNADYSKQKVTVSFTFESEINGVKKLIGIECTPPVFAAYHRQYDPRTGRSEKIYAPNWAQTYRMLFNWLKAKIEAVSYGMTSIEQEFLSQVVVNLPNGNVTTIGKALMETGTLASGRFALEEKTTVRVEEPPTMVTYPEVVDAEIMEDDTEEFPEEDEDPSGS
jgi:hypothetical protein